MLSGKKIREYINKYNSEENLNKIVKIKVDKLKPNEYNPKKLGKKEARDLWESLYRFGQVEPILVNSAENRKNVIIGGHQRYYVYRQKKIKEIKVIYLKIPDIEVEKELCLRLSKNMGEFDLDLLTNFSEEFLGSVGFDDSEIDKIIDMGVDEEEEIPPKKGYEFSEELLEEHNYIVFTFDNVMDWNVIKEKFDLKSVKSLDDEKYKGSRVGVGRVVNGKKLLEAVGEAEDISD